MWQHFLFVSMCILCAATIKVPVDNNETKDTAVKTSVQESDKNDEKPLYYESDDSYLIPPDPQNTEGVLPDTVVTPATYLLPPSPDRADYYYPSTEPVEQSDWYPIAQTPTQDTPLLPPLRQQYEAIPIFMFNNNETTQQHRNPRVGKIKIAEQFLPPVPSLHLEPPAIDAPNDYIINVPSKELELPAEELDHQPPLELNNRRQPIESPIPLHLIPPKKLYVKQKYPTKLYPKKFSGDFKPVPIPIAQYSDGLVDYIPTAKPVKYFKPILSEIDYLSPEDKNVYLYKQAEQKRKLKGENGLPQLQEIQAGGISAESYSEPLPTEQDALESSYRLPPGRNVYPAPLRQAPPQQPQSDPAPAPANDRTEFRMHGMKGPHSYEFGFDTGKGKNRQFRYEERDNDGQVKGHYGYVDKRGKLRVVNYSAHPELGFHAEAPVEKE